MKVNQDIKILELRNYLLKPKTADRFSRYFDKHFVRPMDELGGYTVGQFRIEGERDRFVWMRGFENMQARFRFLNNFYLNSPVWKKYGPEANSMMINSDNVHLLRPFDETLSRNMLQSRGEMVVVDFYACNSTLDKVIDLFKKEYLPFLGSLNVSDITLWLSEMSENGFPRLPVFQDKNLLVTMTKYKNELEYSKKSKEIRKVPAKLDNAMLELITIKNQLVLFPQNHNRGK